MALSEFDIISTYFNKPGLTPDKQQQHYVPLGIGDDCAVLAVPEGKQLAMSMDVLVADVHFPADAEAGLIAQRALAVNLSDLAAMGATPMAFTLGLVLPAADEKWLTAFSEGLTIYAQKYACPLIGGDISSGPLSITIQVHGWLDEGKAIRRSDAKVGDKIYVTGVFGESGLALDLIQGKLEAIQEKEADLLRQSYYQPEPRLAVGQACADLVSAGIDVSDGLLADLGHIAERSHVGMSIKLDKIPVSSVVKSIIGHEKSLKLALTAGDDYELALTVSPENSEQFEMAMARIDIPFTCIGLVTPGEGVACIDSLGNQVNLSVDGYQHF